MLKYEITETQRLDLLKVAQKFDCLSLYKFFVEMEPVKEETVDK